ncbi:MAG: glucans biosynthesis glucosyltransferase MdoH [Mangrovicoccus sp.]|nr:glucans biosynthesis glucosyltransferase MdoH [Mangrovicoccus sp.]
MKDTALPDTATALPREIVAPGPIISKPTPTFLRARRFVFFTLVFTTVAGLVWAMLHLMSYGGGITLIEWGMFLAYVATLPWLAIGFWNSVIGFVIDWLSKDPGSYVNPALAHGRSDAPIRSRTALVMAVRNEDVQESIRRFERIQLGLNRTAYADRFEFHLLSDTNGPAIAKAEEHAVDAWRARSPDAVIHYRRREDNKGFKAGNIMEFLERCGEDYDYYLPLDADSLMGASAILRLVRVMEACPEIGILQGLIVGTPSRTFFTRAFQFGMRNGMRSYTLGSSWWQGDCAPYWGHNALIRTKAFRDNCHLPHIEGSGPLSGHILSHDQVEAVLMRRAGYEVRVLPVEDQSFEDNPPSLPDFIIRELRWCNGNFQYLRLPKLHGAPVVSQIQLWLSILMYAASPAWFLFLILTAVLASTGNQIGAVPPAQGLSLFAAIMAFNLMPKFMGLAQILVSREKSARYGGRLRVFAGGICEAIFGILIAPAVAFSVTIFIIGMCFGHRMRWNAQQRDLTRLGWGEAAKALWPQTLAGLVVLFTVGSASPWALLFAAPVVISLAGAVPLAVLSTNPSLGAWSRKIGLFDTPEDRAAAEIAFDTVDSPAKAATL